MLNKAFSSTWISAIIVLLCVFFLYGKTLSYGYVLDDDIVAKNKQVEQGISAIGSILNSGYLEGFNGQSFSYRPVPLISFALERSLFGNSIAMSRLFHLLLYALGILLLLQLLKQWFSDKPLWIIIAIALLYLAHPIHTEVVCNLKSRDELLLFLFLISTFHALNRFLVTRNIAWLAFSVLCALAALMSKENAITYLVFIPLTLMLVSKLNWKKAMLFSSVYLIPLAIYMLLRQMALSGGELPEETYLYNNAFVHATTLDRIANGAHLTWWYIWKTFVPVNLTWDYSYATLTLVEIHSMTGIASILALAFIFVAGLYYLKKEPIYFWLLVGFCLPLITVLNVFVLIGANFAERFLFTPSLFAVIFLVFMLDRLNQLSRWKLKNTQLIAVGFIFAFALQSFSRVKDWESNETLFLASLETNPESARVQTSIGTEYRIKAEKMPPSPAQESLYKKAMNHYDEAIEILPTAFDAIYNKAVIYQFTGRQDLAAPLFERVLEIDSNFVGALTNLGVIYFNAQKLDQAERLFKRAYALSPNDADAVSNMGVIAHSRGDYSEAEKFYQRSLHIRPNQPIVIRNLNMVQEKLGK